MALDPNELKPAFCEIVEGELRSLTVGDLLDYLAGVPRDVVVACDDSGRTDEYLPMLAIAYVTGVAGEEGGFRDASSTKRGTPIIVMAAR